MIKIKSSEHFNQIVGDFRQKNTEVLTNCYLMKDEIEKLCKKGKLFSAEYEGWLFIIGDFADYSGLYYYTTPDSDAGKAKELLGDIGDRELFIDIVTKNSRGDTETPKRLIEAGFAEPYKIYIRLQQLVRDINYDNYDDTLADGYYWCDDYDDYEEAMKLWKTGLDEKSTPLPTKESFFEHKKDGSILFIVDENRSLAAVYVLTVSGNQSILQHLSVSPEHRRNHLGDKMIYKSLFILKDRGVKKFIFWAFEENLPILKLMKRFGFKEDGTKCEQLIVKK